MTSERILFLMLAFCAFLAGRHFGEAGAAETVRYLENRSTEIDLDGEAWVRTETDWDRACQRMFDAAQEALERDALIQR